MKLKLIGTINTSYKTLESVPFTDDSAREISELVLLKEYESALKDIEQASHLIVFYWLDKSDRFILVEENPHDLKKHGVFATRSQNRPNPMGMTVAELIDRTGNIVKVKGITALDGTPLIDIKPYCSQTDSVQNAKIKWFDEINK